MRCSRGLLSKRVKRSSGSCGAMRTFSCSASVLMREMRAMASEWMSAARERLTSEATCRALWMARGSCSSVRKSWYHARALPSSISASRKKVRQKRLRPVPERLRLRRAGLFWGEEADGGSPSSGMLMESNNSALSDMCGFGKERHTKMARRVSLAGQSGQSARSAQISWRRQARKRSPRPTLSGYSAGWPGLAQ